MPARFTAPNTSQSHVCPCQMREAKMLYSPWFLCSSRSFPRWAQRCQQHMLDFFQPCSKGRKCNEMKSEAISSRDCAGLGTDCFKPGWVFLSSQDLAELLKLCRPAVEFGLSCLHVCLGRSSAKVLKTTAKLFAQPLKWDMAQPL